MAELGANPIGDIIEGLRHLSGIFKGASLASVKIALVNLRASLLDIGKGAVNFAEETRSWLSGLIGIFRRFYSGGLLPLIRWLKDKFLTLQTWLKRVFRPLFDLLLRLRRELLDFYAKFVRPVLDVISAIRFALQVLGRLGVEWAQELDAKLAKLENAIARNYLILLGTINRVIDVVDSVVTFERLFQRVPFLRSMRRDASRWMAIWWATSTSPIGAAAPPESKFTSDPVTVEEDIDEARMLLLFDSGPLAADAREDVADFKRWVTSR